MLAPKPALRSGKGKHTKVRERLQIPCGIELIRKCATLSMFPIAGSTRLPPSPPTQNSNVYDVSLLFVLVVHCLAGYHYGWRYKLSYTWLTTGKLWGLSLACHWQNDCLSLTKCFWAERNSIWEILRQKSWRSAWNCVAHLFPKI